MCDITNVVNTILADLAERLKNFSQIQKLHVSMCGVRALC